jgi:PAS domain-containing protein
MKAPDLTLPCPGNQFQRKHVDLLLDSYRRLLNKPLFEAEADQDLGLAVFTAQFALLSHNNVSDPLFNYANQTALDVFEYSWEELIGKPSRLSAEMPEQEDRQRLLAEVNNRGFISNYSGIRITKTGRRFLISQALVWNVLDQQGIYHGQAAYFQDWQWLA